MGIPRRHDRVSALVARVLFTVGSLAAARADGAVLSPGPLSEAHANLDTATQCFQCHGSAENGPGDRCVDCHKEIGWLVERGRGLHGRPGQPACAKCHPEHAGRGFKLVPEETVAASTFDHTRTGWPLRGKHTPLKCEACHTPRFRVSEALALSPRKSGPRLYLGLETDCATCHADPHKGSEGSDCQRCHVPTVWKTATGFDHDTARFRLDGAHLRVACAKCHRAAYQAQASNATPAPRIFQPLPHAECVACHVDPHRSQLGPQCSRCHVSESFRKVDREAFDHRRTRYPLLGKHASVACAACHDPARGGETKPKFAVCADCHTDPHAGKATLAGRKEDCATCHGVDGFGRSILPLARHQESAYPLEGKHAAVPCERCHRRLEKTPANLQAFGEAAVSIRPAHARCLDCHTDSHGAQFASRPDGGECSACHRVEDFKPSLYTAGDHAKAGFELKGKHAATPCASCHGPEAKGPASRAAGETLGKARQAFRLGEVACVACHADPHDGRFATRAPERGCAACHGVEGFRPAVLSGDAHASLGFPLEGAHRTAACERCHAELRHAGNGVPRVGTRAAAKPVTLVVADSRCEYCHASPHGDQFDARPDHGACASCHDETSFRPARRFLHDRSSRFPLLRSHGRIECRRCHETESDASGRIVTRYRPVSVDCKECHRRTKGKGIEGAPPLPARRVAH